MIFILVSKVKTFFCRVIFFTDILFKTWASMREVRGKKSVKLEFCKRIFCILQQQCMVGVIDLILLSSVGGIDVFVK